LLGDIFSTSAGIAVAFTIVVEGVGYMVLLIPARVKKLKEEGREEGLELGKAAERQAQLIRRKEALERFGIELNGVRMLPDTPEVDEFLTGKTGNQS
jgi:hypothetical protein